MRITDENRQRMLENATNALILGPPGVYGLAHDVISLVNENESLIETISTLTGRLEEIDPEVTT